jgi:cytochrome c oxidase cbb3-type subunit 1
MIAQLSMAERQAALIVLGLLALTGVAITAAGAINGDLIAIHGAIVVVFSVGLMLVVGQQYYAPEPSADQSSQYYDDPTRVGIILAMIWAVVGMFVGVWVAALLAWPELTFVDQAWASFGRLRPVHTSGVIFGFGGNALIATSYHVVQRTSRARLAGQFSPWFVLLGYNLFCILAASGYLMGITQSKEYAEPEWYADIWLTIVWVVYFILFIRTLQRRKEPHIYVANWYYLAFILVVAVLHIVNNLAVPISLGEYKSYSLFSGVQDAMMPWPSS